MNITIKWFSLTSRALTPTRNLSTDAGLDIYASEDQFLPLGETLTIKTDVAIQVNKGEVGKIEGRSSMNKKGILTAGGVIDAGYSGEIGVILTNLNNKTDTHIGTQGYWVRRGDKIAQMLIYPVLTPVPVETKELWSSERGERAWGSSGR